MYKSPKFKEVISDPSITSFRFFKSISSIPFLILFSFFNLNIAYPLKSIAKPLMLRFIIESSSVFKVLFISALSS